MIAVRKLSLLLLAALLSAAAAAGQAASYRVYPLPIASPDHGSRALLANPHDPAASPFGWHDTNGAVGPEFTTLRGNNVWVYIDNASPFGEPDPYPGPNGGVPLVFDYPAAPGVLPPVDYQDALATNAFYLGNMFHDILWHHGFRETDGNFQENNYGQGGLGGDPVRIEIRRGDGTNNANAVNTADGTAPRIRMFEWTSTTPRREGSFEAAIMGWAYMQLVQARLTGTACVGNSEHPTRGYQDWFGALVSTDFAATNPETPRGLATWVLGQPVNGPGIRPFPYSTDMAINPVTYADSATIGAGHFGAIWASVLWDLTWALVQREGHSGNLVTGDGGENRALRLVLQAMKLQPCSAGLVDARNALLAADGVLYGGAYQCDLWQAFARRGLGAFADQGSTASLNDNVPSFDPPATGPCSDAIFANGFEPQPVWSQFCSAPGAILLPGAGTSGSAQPYPIVIPVSAIGSQLAALQVQIVNLSHTFPDDLDFLLVGPGGQNLVIQSDAGGSDDVSNLSYIISDAAPSLLPDGGPLTAGSFRPANYGIGGDPFAAPAPGGPYNHPAPTGAATLAGVFGGSNPNGNWSLYIVDDASDDAGTLSSVCLEIGWMP